MAKLKVIDILSSKVRGVVFKVLEYTSASLPSVLRPALRPIYKCFTRSSLVRRLIWGVTSMDKCHEYWKSPIDEDNKPTKYLDGGISSLLMLDFIQKYADKDAKILEIGCNVGRNLEVLHEAGYKNLFGIEINAEAIEVMKAQFPDMASNTTIYNNAVEKVIKDLPDSEYLVFTMAVLEHIHEDSSWVFGEMTRITRNVLITLEDEVAVSWRTFARDYLKVFESLGMKQVEFNNCQSLPKLYGSFKLRVFRK